MKRFLPIILIICLATAGCEQAGKALSLKKQKKAVASQENILPKVNNSDLAKIILKREKTKLDISRDPFAPIRHGSYSSPQNDAAWGVEDIRNFKFKGVTKIGDEYIAFLQNGSKKGAFRVEDLIAGYAVKQIDSESVVLTNGTQEVTLKRSDQSEQYKN